MSFILQFLKENGEVREQDNLPNIDDECNHLEVSEYIDEIYQYYWVTEVIFIKPLMSSPPPCYRVLTDLE